MWSKVRNVGRGLAEGEGSIGQVLCNDNRLANGDGPFPINEMQRRGQDHQSTAEACVSRQSGVARVICRAIDKYIGPKGVFGFEMWDLLC
jgi:formate-dependent phosphoribosylglycinamide formyltransferase (GAR transformylase)